MSYQTKAVRITGADTSRDGTGANAVILFTALADCYVEAITWQSIGTITTAIAARCFVNNGENPEVGDNNRLRSEVTIPTATASETAAIASVAMSMDLYLRKGQRLIVTCGTAPDTGVDVSATIAPHYRDFNV